MASVLLMTIEIEMPEDLSDEAIDAMVDDLSVESHLERLEHLIKRWACFITGENCHVFVEVE